jgi:hypothetical protein
LGDAAARGHVPDRPRRRRGGLEAGQAGRPSPARSIMAISSGHAFYYAEDDLHEFHLMMFEVLIVKSASWLTFDSLW